MEKAMTTLKPLLSCPFCGGKPEWDDKNAQIFCPSCGFYFSTDGYDNFKKAFEFWDSRSTSPEVEEALKQAVDALRYYAEKMVVPHGDIARAALARIEGLEKGGS